MTKVQDQIGAEDLSARRRNPSSVWRAGQDRRLDLILRWGFSTYNTEFPRDLVDGCGVGMRERPGNLSHTCSV